jgi:hypothetical protein
MALLDAISKESEREIVTYLDRAIAIGAQLNDPDAYERNALVIAVRANRHAAIGPLVCRGALPPLVPPSGIDLLMEACKAGHVQLVVALIGRVDFGVNFADDKGMCALHHAVQSGSISIVRLLLDSGADPNAAAHHLRHEEITEIFGTTIPLMGKAVSPLMIAIGLGHEGIACLLLNAGADPNTGGCSPLILAACNNQKTVFDALLSHGAMLGKCQNGHGDYGLYACIYARMPVEYLTRLLPQHDFRRDPGSVLTPLGSAVSLFDFNIVALLLACDAPVEDHHNDTTPFSLWEQALPPKQISSGVLDLLTAKQPVVIAINDIPAIETLFGLLLSNIHEPACIASKGFFTSLLCPAFATLTDIAEHDALAPQQSSLEVAWNLSCRLPSPDFPAIDINPATLLPHQRWQRRMLIQRHEQCNKLKEAANHLITERIGQLKEIVTSDFLNQCLTTCPPGMSVSDHLAHQIAVRSGAPASVVQMISVAWSTAAQLDIDWKITHGNALEHSQFLIKLARSLLQKSLEDANDNGMPLVGACLSALREALPSPAHALTQFCSDPAVWLQQFEERTNRASGELAAYKLQIELGLPLGPCTAIMTLWQQSVQQAQSGAWGTPERAQFKLNQQLATNIPKFLFADGVGEIIPMHAHLLLLKWRLQLLSNPPAIEASRKRPADDEAPGAPPRKEAKS